MPVERTTTLSMVDGVWSGRFRSMASPCELLLRDCSEIHAQRALLTVANEAWRIEDKFSRYLNDNIVASINDSDGHTVEVDDETANLLDFAVTLYELSDGHFDITSGVLRRAWQFDGSDNLPSQDAINDVLRFVGWHNVRWHRPQLTMQPGMQIDFGGIGKEYAVDRAAACAHDVAGTACLVNFGGDVAASGEADPAWQVGIEALDTSVPHADRIIHLTRGAIATSGDSRRYLLKDGRRYSHILDPVTGWPVVDAPRSITVAADTCTEAGMLATLAMLRGAAAESFLDEQQVQYWCRRQAGR